MPLVDKEIYRFDRFILDPVERILSCDGAPVSLTPKAFDTLVCLVRNQGRMVTKDELLRQVWPDTFVEEINLAVNISTIRKALGESAQECRFIVTVPGRGYRFIGEVCNVNGNQGSADNRETDTTVAAAEDQEVGCEPEKKFVFARSHWSRLRFAVLVTPVLLLATIFAAYVWRRGRTPNVSAPSKASIAVLPFADLSKEQDQQYFSDGLAEELINDLAQVPNLKVVARSSAFEFRGRNEDLRSVGHKLGVSNILEGSIRKERDRFRISVELTNAETGFQIWSQTYDRKISDIFAVQDDIASAVTGVLETKLTEPGSSMPAKARRTSPEAYEAYLQGQYFLGRGESKEDLENALSFANRAITLDAHYAPAWVLRSATYNLMAGFRVNENTMGMRKAREDAERAIKLDPTLASAYLALGYIQLSYDWDWSGAQTSGKKAAELAPGNAEVLRYQSALNEALGRLPEAIDNLKRAIMSDPLLPRSYTSLGAQLYELGKYEEARAALHKALELNPQKEHDHALEGEVLLAEGQLDQALSEVEQEPSIFWKHFEEALVYKALNRQEDSDNALNAIIATDQNGAAMQIGEVYAYRGDTDKAFAWLDRAYRQRDGGLTLVEVDPLLKNIRRNRRYPELLKRMGLPN